MINKSEELCTTLSYAQECHEIHDFGPSQYQNSSGNNGGSGNSDADGSNAGCVFIRNSCLKSDGASEAADGAPKLGRNANMR